MRGKPVEVQLLNFKVRRARDRGREERRVREAEMSSVASGMAAGGRKVW